MSCEPIISVSGLRGIVGESLTPDIAVRYVGAWLANAPEGPIVLSRDGRASGQMLADLLRGAIVAAGRRCLVADVAATPTVGVLVNTHQAAGAVQITASHNPPEYNGIKLFSNDGRIIPNEPGVRVLANYRQGKSAWVAHDRLGDVHRIEDPHAAHLTRVLGTVERDAISARQNRVLVDANHGSGGVLARRLLEALGCQVVFVGEQATGEFLHAPEPVADNLTGVLNRVVSDGASVGFCQDPDADRLAIIDEAGRYIGEEKTLAICTNHVLRKRSGAVVTNCSTSRMTQDIAAKHDVPFFHSKVGEANVVDEMLKRDSVLGGEGNGGVIDPRVGLVRDSFAAMALVLDAMASRDASISFLADELPQYSIHKTKAPLAASKLDASFAALEKHFADATPNRMDGLRLDWPDNWLLIRASNTEPIVRIIAEAKTAVAAEQACADAAAVLQRV